MRKIAKRGAEGFTLIELLVVISIIGVLSTVIMTSVSGARVKAKRVSFQTTAASMQAALMMCCEGSNTSLRPAAGSPAAGGAICFDSATHAPLAAYPSYPGEKSLATITLNAATMGSVSLNDCNQGSFSVTVTPGTEVVGGWTSATCDHEKCIFS